MVVNSVQPVLGERDGTRRGAEPQASGQT